MGSARPRQCSRLAIAAPQRPSTTAPTAHAPTPNLVRRHGAAPHAPAVFGTMCDPQSEHPCNLHTPGLDSAPPPCPADTKTACNQNPNCQWRLSKPPPPPPPEPPPMPPSPPPPPFPCGVYILTNGYQNFPATTTTATPMWRAGHRTDQTTPPMFSHCWIDHCMNWLSVPRCPVVCARHWISWPYSGDTYLNQVDKRNWQAAHTECYSRVGAVG